ncbi:phosphatidylinositol phosphatase PTPRQ-like isoform X2 [Andrena cerasifolii]|uniref:phosphatidylinositol phosphatase PTPRQ-like isoform X2 n=1 Tax=Andrena cerasifolii TaxID=2819439 RepID=UPI004038130B
MQLTTYEIGSSKRDWIPFVSGFEENPKFAISAPVLNSHSLPRNMILRKRSRLFIYALQILHVLAEDVPIDITNNGGTNDPVSPLGYVERTTVSEASDHYEEFPAETTEVAQSDPLTDDHPNSSDVNTPTADISTSDFVERFPQIFSLSGEMVNNDVIGDESSTSTAEEQNSVQKLNVNDTGMEWISLSWDSPAFNESLTYLIDVRSSDKQFQINATSTRYNVTKLDPCTTYTFTVKVIDKDPVGVAVVAATSSDITEIGEVQDLVVNTTTNAVSLSWKAPAKYPTCVRSYLITQCFKTDCNNTGTTKTQHNATNLEPCTEYVFTVIAVAYPVESHGLNRTVKTDSQKSSVPQHLMAEASAFSLFIHWQPPEIGPACIKHYRVTIAPQATTKETVGTNVTIHGLRACTYYFIYINAVDEDNNDGEMVTKYIRTASTESAPPILNIDRPLVSTNNISLSWKIAKDNNNCNVVSLKATCNYIATNGHGYETVNGETEVLINSHIQDEFLIVHSTVSSVSPYTAYLCWAYVTNEAGNSKLSDYVNITTLEDVPSAPAFNVANITQSQFALVWETPKYLAGNLHEFEIALEWQALFPVPEWCSKKQSKSTIHLSGNAFTFEYLEAQAYTNYKAKIRAKTAAGWGSYSEYLAFRTLPGVPEMVTNFSYLITNSKDDANILDTILKWGQPCSSNGIIEYFNVFVHGTRTNYTPHSLVVEKYVPSGTTENDMLVLNLKELKGEYNYTFEVSTKVNGVRDFGLPTSLSNILYPAGIPPEPDEDYIKSITIDPSKARRSTTSATLLLPLFPAINGDVLYYSIIVSGAEASIASSTRFDLNNHTWPNISSWEEAMLKDFSEPYQATRLCWNPYPNYVADYGDMKAVKYTLGEDTNCEEISSNSKKRVYCNGPLKPNTWYHVRMRALTRGGYADSKTFLIKTNAEINVGLVTGVVFGILFLGILTTMMLLVRKCSPQVILRRFLHSDMSGSPVPTPFSKKKFIAHCQQLIDNPGKLSNEFQLLQTLSVDLQMPTNTACLQANKKKNRYSDILPYDFSRVKLEAIDNDPNTDYINASFIKGYTGEDEYIACQGPKEETTFDFWRMVEQYNINIIIMLTQLVEKGKEKCHQYFPTIRESFRYENMTIKCISELDYRSYTQRTLVLQKENKKRNITHLHFKDWPDHDVPEDFDPMIHFCQVIRRNILANKGYIVIHCSAGIGRTGTLIAIDILLQHLRDNRKLDVFGTVYRLRHHRINMVQKESQYAYIYNSIKQVLKNPYCLKTYKPPPMNPLSENASKKPKVISNSNASLVKNFEMCM